MPIRHAAVRPILAAAAGLVTFTLASTAIAQPVVGTPMPREFGIDGGATIGFGDLEGTAIQFPAQNFRVGFFRSPTTSIEPFGSLNYFSFGDADITQVSVGTGVLYHFSPDRARGQAYVRPFAAVDFVSGGGESETQFQVGGGLGVKVPWQDRFAWRLEAALGYAVETGDLPGGPTLGLLAGLSFFTR